MGKHKHKCSACGNIWEHGDDMVNNRAAHTCSECGTVTWMKYFADGAGDLCRELARLVLRVLA